MTSVVEPHAWIGLKLPSENVRFLQVTPNTTISLGKYGSFPSNLIIHRPFHFTYELQDKLPNEEYCRLRVIPPAELHADILADEAKALSQDRDDKDEDDCTGMATPNGVGDSENSGTATPGQVVVLPASDGFEYSLIDMESQAVIARSNRDAIDQSARQALTTEEIEELKREGTGAGKELIAKLLLSHAALDQKTTFSLAKYKLLKTKKYIRRFTVVPLDVCSLGNWLLDDKDVGAKILGLRDELIALVGCWANVHYGGADRYLEAEVASAKATTGAVEVTEPAGQAATNTEEAFEAQTGSVQETFEGPKSSEVSVTQLGLASQLGGGRWLMVDDTGGLLVAAMAERMGVLYSRPAGGEEEKEPMQPTVASEEDCEMGDASGAGNNLPGSAATGQPKQSDAADQTELAVRQRESSAKRSRDDLHVPISLNNTLTLLHANTQANLAYLKYFGFDHTDPNHKPHPLAEHLLCLSWLQLLDPASDTLYASAPPEASAEEMATWKPARRGNWHRKRRRWARTRHVVDATRAGGFSGLVVATTMDLVSTLRHTLPLLAGGAPIAVYSPTLEPLAVLADCFSISRRTAWMAGGAGVPAAAHTLSADDLEQWPGSPAFPINPMLLLGATVQTSRACKWQVLPGRTHPLMTQRGGAEGYIFTGWKARPAEGRVTARGRYKKRKMAGGDAEAVDTP